MVIRVPSGSALPTRLVEGARGKFVLDNLSGQTTVHSTQLAVGILACLRQIDDIAYLRAVIVVKKRAKRLSHRGGSARSDAHPVAAALVRAFAATAGGDRRTNRFLANAGRAVHIQGAPGQVRAAILGKEGDEPCDLGRLHVSCSPRVARDARGDPERGRVATSRSCRALDGDDLLSQPGGVELVDGLRRNPPVADGTGVAQCTRRVAADEYRDPTRGSEARHAADGTARDAAASRAESPEWMAPRLWF